MIDQVKLEKLLGRSLTDSEINDFEMFLEVSLLKLEQLVGSPLKPVSEKRLFSARSGYRAVGVDIFRTFKSIKRCDTDELIKAVPSYNGILSNGWFNQIALNQRITTCDNYPVTLEIDADWGFDELPSDLALVLAMIFDMVANSSRELAESKVESKRVEDFSVTFVHDKTVDQRIRELFGLTIDCYKSQYKGELR